MTERTKAALRKAWLTWPEADWTPLLERFLSLPQVETANTILLFFGVGREPDTRPLIDELMRRGKGIALPRCMPGCQMEIRLIDRLEGLHPGAYGIPEPGEEHPLAAKTDIDLVLVPNLCCDRDNYRLGHGGGYYDRWLADYRGFTVALCPEIWLQDRVPRDGFDRQVDLVLTQ